jgi:hypothetical protein
MTQGVGLNHWNERLALARTGGAALEEKMAVLVRLAWGST